MTNQQNILRKNMEFLGGQITTSIIQQIVLSEQYDILSERHAILKKKILKYNLSSYELNQKFNKDEILTYEIERQTINAEFNTQKKEKERLKNELRLEEERCDQVLRKEYRKKQQLLHETH
jgi:hypothetical protein